MNLLMCNVQFRELLPDFRLNEKKAALKICFEKLRVGSFFKAPSSKNVDNIDSSTSFQDALSYEFG